MKPFILARAVSSDGIVDRMIKWRTGSKFSHVEFRLDEDWHAYVHGALTEASLNASRDADGQKIPQWLLKAATAISVLPAGDYGTLGARLDGGVQIRPSDYAKFNLIRNLRIDVTEEEKADVIAAALRCVGDSYSIGTVAGDAIEQNYEHPNEYDCSDFLNRSMGVVKYLQQPIDGAGLITPRDIAMSPLAIVEVG